MLRKSIILLIVSAFVMFAVPSFANDVIVPTTGIATGDNDTVVGQGQAVGIDDHSVNEAMEARPNSGPVPIPGQPGWFTTPTPDGSFQSLKTILQYGSVFTEGALEKMASGRVKVDYLVGNDKDEVARVKFADNLKRKIMIVIEKPKANFVAYANGDARNGKTGSVQVMAAVALAALRDGANVIYFSAEGAHRKVEAFGWGIGLSYVRANESSMGTGGTGISGGNSGPEDRPWLQGAAFVDPDLKLPDSLKKAAQTGNHMPQKKAEVKKVAPVKAEVKKVEKKAEVAFVPSTGNIVQSK